MFGNILKCFFFIQQCAVCCSLQVRSGVRDCAVRFVYLCYHLCPRMEFLKAYSSESESEFGQEECDDSETLSSTERSESPVRDLNESAVRQVYLVMYTQADLKKFPTRRCFAEAVIRSFHGTNANVLHWVCCREVHKNGGYHYHMTIKLDRCKRWLPAKNYLKDEQDISVHFFNVHYNYYTVALGNMLLKRTKRS